MKKLFGFLLTFSLVFGLAFGSFSNSAQAITFDELVAQVTSLKNEIVSLKKMMTGNVLGATTSSVLKQGSTGSDVVAIQSALKASGYFSGKVDGVFGSVTTSAVSKYQAANGLKVTGVVDESLKFSIIRGGDSTVDCPPGAIYSTATGLPCPPVVVNSGFKFPITCLSKSSNVVTPYPPTRSLRFTVGTDGSAGYFYIKPGEKPALYPHNALLPNSGPYPKAPYTVGSGSTRLTFYASLPENDYPAGAFNFANNPDTGIDTVLGQLYGLSLDGTTYFPISPYLKGYPPCDNEPAVQAPATSTLPVCPLCGILGETSNGGTNSSFAHWPRGENPVTIDVNFSADPAYYQNAFTYAYADWNASPVLDLQQSVVGSGGTPKIKITSGYYDEPWLGTTGLWFSGPHILPGVEIKLNNKYLANGGQYATDAWRQHVLCDGLGHAFGLGHQDSNLNNPINLGSCMDATKDPTGQINGTLSNLHPNANDFAALLAAHHVNPGDGNQARPSGADSAPTSVTYTISVPN